jgi:hypothetical protein
MVWSGCVTREALLGSLLVAALLACTAPSGASAQMMMMRRTDLVQVADCPLVNPYAPEPDRSRTTPDQQSLFFPMDGHLFHRIQFTGVSAPTDLEIIWTPDNPYFPNKGPASWLVPWPQKTAHLSVSPDTSQCFFNWFFSPGNVPGHIEIRARQSLAGLKVSFSDRTWDHEGECPARPLCPALVKFMHQCRSAPRSKSCDAMIDAAEQLTPRYQCRRSVDFEPVPAIWVCDELTATNVLGDTMHLLKRLKAAKARQFYRSGNFRGVLDGAFLEEYLSDPALERPASRRAQ